MKRLPKLMLVAVAAIFFASCGRSKTGLAVPKDASVVFHIDAESLSSKLKWEEIKATEWFRDALQNEQDSLTRKIMENPETSGIDIRSDFMAFMKNQGSFNYIVFQGKLKDAGAFEAMLKQKEKDAKIEKDGTLSYIRHESSLISWTSSQFMFSSLSPEAGNPLSGNGGFQRPDLLSSDSLVAFTKALLDLSKDNSLESDERFTDLLKEKGDAHFWVNMDSYSSAFADNMQDEALSTVIASFEQLYKGSVSMGTINFEDGRIAMRSKQYVSEQMKKILDKHEMKPVSADLINRIPGDSAAMVIAANYPPELTMEILRATGLVPIVNGFLKKYNYSLDELMQATKGQILVALTDFSFNQINKIDPESGYAYPSMEPNINAFLAMSVNNKASVDKLIGIAESQLDSARKSMVFSKVVYRSTNDWFAISTSAQTADQFLAGGNSKQHFADKISGHPIGMYVDLKKVIGGMGQMLSRGATADTKPGIFENIIITGGDYKNGISTGEFIVNLTDKSTNSLKQFNSYMENSYREQKKRREEMQRPYLNDSTVVPAPSAY